MGSLEETRKEKEQVAPSSSLTSFSSSPEFCPGLGQHREADRGGKGHVFSATSCSAPQLGHPPLALLLKCFTGDCLFYLESHTLFLLAPSLHSLLSQLFKICPVLLPPVVCILLFFMAHHCLYCRGEDGGFQPEGAGIGSLDVMMARVSWVLGRMPRYFHVI